MRLFLAGLSSVGRYERFVNAIKGNRPYALESYAYMNQDLINLLPYFDDFLLDSGTFTFVKKAKTKIDWKKYVAEYEKFIDDNRNEKYFELDIDALIGYEGVKEIRKELERQTKTQCIPVWHISRGLKDFEETTKKYPYVAVGGINFIKRGLLEKYKSSFPTLIRIAHQNGAKLHGLGYTSLKGIKKHHFDSVDSTTWITGKKFGRLFKFENGEMKVINKPQGYRYKKEKGMDVLYHDILEWMKYQKYVDKNY